MTCLRIRDVLLAFLILFSSLPALADSGDVIRINVKGSAAETLESLKDLIVQKRYKIFSEHDYGDNKSVKQVIAFGKANHNARIMWHDSAAGLELPFKIAVLQDDVGTQVIYRKPSSLRNTYSLEDCKLLDEMDGLMADLAQNAAQ